MNCPVCNIPNPPPNPNCECSAKRAYIREGFMERWSQTQERREREKRQIKALEE